MRVAILCEEGTGARALQLVARSGHEVALVLSSPGSSAWIQAQKLGISPASAGRVREAAFAAELAALRIDLVLNVHSLYIVPEAVLRVPLYGAYNLHPGPLPEYAGLNTPSWAIYNGEETHGVSLHRMERGIDTGPIAFEERFPIAAEDTGLSLSLRCAEKELKLIERLLAADLATLALQPQNLARRRYFGREVPQGGRIDWRASARRIDAFVRACDYHPFRSPWGAPVGEIAGEEVSILKVAMTGQRCHAPPGTVRAEGLRTFVATGDEWLELRRTSSPIKAISLCQR
jgi:methionyl-tRNA formyltransferase